MLVNRENCLEALRVLKNSTSSRIVMDLETDGLNPFADNRLIGVAIQVDGQSFYYPFRHGQGRNLPYTFLPILLKHMARFETWSGWNVKFDAKFIEVEGGQLPKRLEDVMLAAHIMNENEPNFKLKSRGKHYIDPTAGDEEEELADRLRLLGLGKGSMWMLPPEEVGPYAEMDVILTEKLRAFYEPHLQQWKLWDLWQEVNDYLMVVHRMESRGLMLDFPVIQQRIAQCAEEAAKAKQDLETALGYNFNPNSAPQVKSALSAFGILVENTRVETLTSLDHPIAKRILDYRRWVKADSTYYQKFLQYAGRDGELHPNLSMTGTVTGRFSSSKPNLQAIPRKEDEFQPKNYVKSAFRPRDGYVLVQVDYKQAEVYLGAAYASARKMFEYLRKNVDVHKETANELGLPRAVAKRLNFSMQYGIGARTLAGKMREAGLKISEEQARDYIRRYNTLHPEFKQLYNFANARAEQNGYIRLFTGRVRRYNELVVSTPFAKASPTHKASSNLIQGGVAEIMRLASTAIHRELYSQDVHQLLHVHDSILFEVPTGRVDLIDRIQALMTDPQVINVLTKYGPKQIAKPFQVDVEIGERSWYELIPLEEYRAKCQNTPLVNSPSTDKATEAV